MSKLPQRAKPKQWPYVKYVTKERSWMVDARTKTGGSRRFFPTKQAAETFASQCRIQRENEGTSAFGNEELARYGKTVKDAVAFYLEHLRLQERSTSVNDAVTELIELKKSSGASRRYIQDLGLRLGRFRADFGEKLVSIVSTADIDSWLVDLGVAGSTRNTFRRDIRTFFSFSARRGYCPGNPARDTARSKESHTPPGILSVNETISLLRATPAELIPTVAIGFFAGLRSAEIEKLDWSEINLDSAFIEVKASKAKTSARRLVPISENLAAWLQSVRKEKGKIVIEGQRYKLDATRRKIGFGRPDSETKEERAAGIKLHPWPQNAARHSFVSYRLALTQDVARTALEAGNTPQMIFQHYRELVRPSEAVRYWSILPEKSD